MTKAKTQAKGRPLRCGICASQDQDLSIPGAGNRRTVRGKLWMATYVRCLECAHEWFSVHPEAIRRGRESDKAAIAAGGGLDDDA